MPFSPLHSRALPRLAACSVALACAVAGCESLRLSPTAPVTPPRSADVKPPPALPAVASTAPPGKHATRCGYYVLYHDFELNKSDPLFTELESLPEQVFGELKLPPTTAVVQVFLFDTQERYERYMRAKYRSLNLPDRRAYFIVEPRIGGGGRVENLHLDGRAHLHRPTARADARSVARRAEGCAALARRGPGRVL